MSELCVRSGVSRKSGYQLLKRFQAEGDGAFLSRSHRPVAHPSALEETLVEKVLNVRRQYPSWGPKKIRALLLKQAPPSRVPAASTIGTLLEQAGLVVHRRKRRMFPVIRPPVLGEFSGPNAIWCVDFKGQFRLGDGTLCYPLTITDGYSRYLLRCQGLRNTSVALARPIFEAAFREFGLPEWIRSDNGVPFATTGVGGLSELSVWWLTLGIKIERIVPGHPEQNGRHERMHRTLKAETTHPPEADMRLQQQRFERFGLEFNTIRPHEALGQETPDSVYVPSSRMYPCPLVKQQLEEGEEFRQVALNGNINIRKAFYMGTALIGQTIRLGVKTGDRRKIWFYEVLLGEHDEQEEKLLQPRREGSMGLDNTGSDGLGTTSEGCPQPLDNPKAG